MKKSGLIFMIIGVLLFSAAGLWADSSTGQDTAGGVDENALFGSDNSSTGSTDTGVVEPADNGTGTANAANETSTDEKTLFGNKEGVVEEVDKSKMASSLQNTLLSAKGVEIGGKYKFSTASSWMWKTSDLAASDINLDTLKNPDSTSLDTTLNASIYFDGRPDENFRVFGKAEITYPFTVTDSRILDEFSTAADLFSDLNDIFKVKELFSDFNWNNIVFFRGGKQTINWGVGYFFSPADIINLTPINPEDPEAEREGPVALKVNIPMGIHNTYLYVIDENIEKPDELEIAPKLELVLGNSELGLGGVYQKDHSPTAMATVTTSIWDFDLFGEGVLSYGSDKTFIDKVDPTMENPLGLETKKIDDQYFTSATAGLRYSYNDDDGNFNISIAAQYFYNGQGYSDKDFFKDNTVGIAALLASDSISANDISMHGMHYGAASLFWNGMFNTDMSFNLFWMGNLADGSGQVTPALTYDFFDQLSALLKVPFTYGDKGYQFTQNGSSLSVSLELSMGTGSF